MLHAQRADIALQFYGFFQCSICCWPCSVLALCRCWRLFPWHHATRLLHEVERASAGVQRTARGGVPDPNPWYPIWVAIRNPGLHLNNSSTLQCTSSPAVRVFPTQGLNQHMQENCSPIQFARLGQLGYYLQQAVLT